MSLGQGCALLPRACLPSLCQAACHGWAGWGAPGLESPDEHTLIRGGRGQQGWGLCVRSVTITPSHSLSD